jgi:hypothetical protein
LAKLAARVAKRVRRFGDFTDTSLSGAIYPKQFYIEYVVGKISPNRS